MMTDFFFDNERYDFWLRLLFTEWFDLRDESSNWGKFIVFVFVLFDVNDFYLLFDLLLLSLLTLSFVMLFSVEFDLDFLLGVP